MKKKSKKDGGALLVVIFVALIVLVFSAGMLKVYDTDAIESVRVEQSGQAFWIAECGLQQALNKLRINTSFRNNPYSLVDDVAEGNYQVDVTRDSLLIDKWTIVSTGTVQGVSRVLQMTPLLTAEVGYAIMGLGGDSTMRRNGSVVSNVYQFGTLNVRSGTTINGTVQALDANGVDYETLTSDDALEMEIDSSAFDFSISGLAPAYTSDGYLDLSNKVVVVNGNYSLTHGTRGNGTLIVRGTLSFDSNPSGFNVGDDATILARDGIRAQKDGAFGNNVLVYTQGDMLLQKAASGDSTTFLIEGDLTLKKELDFKGLIFAEGNIASDKDLKLEGSLIAGDGFTLKMGFDVKYDASYIPSSILNNMIVKLVYAAKPGTWKELAAF